MSIYDGTTPEERDAMQRQLNLSVARQNTHDLRHSMEPRWQRLRGRVEEAAILLEDAAVATKNTEDYRQESG